ncbi:hypothetical protein BDA96_01G527200 [Sorghum bicolor]|uniref:Uncharacterized protein n=1 Tax=Sorghum bicolor TaxID=4558 RepID=A0A921V2N5_SORBI|nr:hypothetical protein BDA96_01G527200 [Sorghum bicolor]
MARVVMVALLLFLMQFCNVILAARPLLQVAASGGGGRGISEALIMQVLKGPGGNCNQIQAPNFGPCPPS